MTMTQPAEATDLQFDRAEFGGQPASQTCAACQQPIADSYFDVNGQITCPTCRQTIADTLEKNPGWTAPFKALGAGLAGGLVGAFLYYAVLKLTGYEIGLIAIVVGLLVGRAVRWGSGGRGGRVYQVMAVAITYLAIVSTYVPFIIEGIRDNAAQQAQQAAQQAGQQTAQQTAATDGTSAPTPPSTPATAPATEAATSSAATEEMTGGSVAIALLLLFLLLLATPFLAGFSNIIGWLIIGFALWEAWKANRRVPLAIAGPFALAPAGGAGAADVPPLPNVPPPLPPPDLPPAPAAS
jgi:hypothetical protein